MQILYNPSMRRMYSYDKTLPDGRVISACLPRMAHLRANITYKCDRQCPNCNRACGVAKSSTDEDMSVAQFKKVMAESTEIEKKWTKIVFTGGEPSMHPDLTDFCAAAVEYKNKTNPECNIWVSTYQHPKYFNRVEAAIKAFPVVKIMGPAKTVPRIHNFATYLAPVDDPQIAKDHPYRGCHLNASLCGCTVDYKGFHPCPVAPAIARVFGLDIAVPDIKSVSVDSLTDQYAAVCGLCGFYTMTKVGNQGEPKSPAWEKALKEYNGKKS
jgi:hypothetical protein